MNVQQFHAGEKAEATVEFIHGDRVGRVTATFAHADDPATKLLLSGEPEEQVASGGAGYTYWRVTLSCEVTTGEKLGEYRMESLEAEYSGGRRVPFGNAPDVGIRIDEEEIPPPEVSGNWEWGKGS